MEKAEKGLIAAVCTALSVYFGRLIVPFAVLTGVMVLDYITGMTRAYLSATLSSRIGVRGILKKLGYFGTAAVALCCDWLLSSGLCAAGVENAPGAVCCCLVLCWLIVNELLSILENLAQIGVPMPGFLHRIVEKLLIRVEQKGGGDGDDAE